VYVCVRARVCLCVYVCVMRGGGHVIVHARKIVNRSGFEVKYQS